MYRSLGLLPTALCLVGSSPVAFALPDGVISAPLHRIKNQSAYGLELQVGNPPQQAVVLVDTGSPTYSFESPLNSVCAAGLCELYGLYDNTSSSTSEWISDGFNDLLIDHGFGSFMNDTIRLGAHTLDDMYFGVIEQYGASFPITTPQAPIFGLGAICTTAECNSYPTFLQQLYDRGTISKRAFSVYLGPDDPDAPATLLIGGIDGAKRQAPVYNHKVLDPTDVRANGQPNFVGVESLRLELANGTTKTHTFENDTYALWDTGSPRWYMPQDIFEQLAPHLGLSPDASESPIDVDCSYRDADDGSALVANFGEGTEIKVPLQRLVTKLADNHCVTYVASSGEDGITFGDPFLRSIYLTFDYEELTVEFAAVKYTDETDIVKIE